MFERRVNDVLSYNRKSTVNLGVVPESLTQQEIADIYYPVEMQKAPRHVLRKRNEKKSTPRSEFVEMTEKRRSEKRGGTSTTMHKKYEPKSDLGKRKNEYVDQNASKRQR